MVEKNNVQEVMKDVGGYFKKGQRKAIYNACDSFRDKVLIRLLWKSGRRIGEILQLRVKDIDFDNKQIAWHIEKKRKDFMRVKDIDEFTINLLKAYIESNELNPNDYILFGYETNKPISRQRAFQIVRRTCEKAGIYYVGNSKPHPHHFRHTFAINWVRNSTSGEDIRKLQKFLEHSTLTTTETYLQFADENSRSLVEMDED